MSRHRSAVLATVTGIVLALACFGLGLVHAEQQAAAAGDTRCWPSKADPSKEICRSVAVLQGEFDDFPADQPSPLLLARDALNQAHAEWAQCTAALAQYQNKANAEAIKAERTALDKALETSCTALGQGWDGEKRVCVKRP